MGRQQKTPRVRRASFRGRGERIRTSDPVVPNDVRYQAALRPANHDSPLGYCS